MYPPMNGSWGQPFRCAEPGLPDLSYPFHNGDGFSGGFRCNETQWAQNHEPYEQCQQERGGRGLHGVAYQPAAQRPGRDCENGSPSQRGQEAPQGPDRQQRQRGDHDDASKQLQGKFARHVRSPLTDAELPASPDCSSHSVFQA